MHEQPPHLENQSCPKSTLFSFNSLPLRVSGIYLLVGALGILLVDWLESTIATCSTTLPPLQSLKSWVLLLAAAWLIYRLLEQSKQRQLQDQSRDSVYPRSVELLTLYKISQIALNNQSLKAAFQEIVEEISTATHFPMVVIELYDKPRQMMVFEGIKGIPVPSGSGPLEVPVAQTASGTVARTGQALVKTYIPQESKPCDSNESLSQLGIKTFICVPMTVNQDTIGTLSLAHSEIVQTDQSFLHWITSLANFLALLIDRKWTEAALRDNENFLKLSLDFNHIGSWDWHTTTNKVVWNDNHARLLGFMPGDVEASYQLWRQSVHPDDIDRVERAVSHALETHTNFEAEYRIIHSDGTLRWLVGRGRGLYDETGQPVRMLGVVIDITDRKLAEQEIWQLNETLERQNHELEALVEQRTAELLTLVNTLPDYIFVIDRKDMRFLFCNEQNARFIGSENRQQVEGKTVFECFSPEIAAELAAQNQKVFESGETIHFQASYPGPRGTLYLDTYKIPLKQPNGHVYALIGAARDITELVKARQKLTARTLQLEATNQELESFSYSVSHDLRAPLRHISGFVIALADRLKQVHTLEDPDVTRYLKIIQDSSQKMGQLIDGLLMLSRVGRRQMMNTPVNLNDLLEAVLVQLSEGIGSENAVARGDVQFIVGELPTVMGDNTLLCQVFTNLIDNAIKFSRDRHPARIEIGALLDDTIFVRDNGAGFQMEYADQLFGAFQRLHSQAEFEGTGIGLAIVQRIIHRHGGTIWAESQPNQGATFYFKIKNIQRN